MLGQKFVIISDEEMAQELLVKNGNNFAGRPQIRALIDHKLGPAYSALMDRHDTWKFQRKWVHAAMAAAHQQHFYGHIENEVKRWLVTLLLDPEKFHGNTRELTGRIISRLAWDDASLGKAYGDSAIATLTQMSVSGPVVNTMTPLWHLGDLIRYNPWRNHEVAREKNQRAWWLRSFRLAKARYRRSELPSDTWTYRYFEQLQKAGNETLMQSEKDEDFAACMLGFQCLVGVKGTIILACEWNINRVREKYPDPDHYRPDRYLEPGFPTYQEPLSRYPNFRDGVGMHTFGWGRRTCLGQNLVDDEMFVAGAAVCWAFDMGLKKCPATGKDVTFDTEATNSNVILEPLPFPMQFKVRSSERAQTLLEGYNAIRNELKV
ncbi:hypothetical protein K4K48_000092 [Colletotrichum sp. SAR 10_66]|nr:hypothetical protein K4K48_000092 [Colletotrichum sp. SAR 10_66]